MDIIPHNLAGGRTLSQLCHVGNLIRDTDIDFLQHVLHLIFLVIKNKAPCMAVGKIAHDTALKNPDGYEYNHDFCTE